MQTGLMADPAEAASPEGLHSSMEQPAAAPQGCLCPPGHNYKWLGHKSGCPKNTKKVHEVPAVPSGRSSIRRLSLMDSGSRRRPQPPLAGPSSSLNTAAASLDASLPIDASRNTLAHTMLRTNAGLPPAAGRAAPPPSRGELLGGGPWRLPEAVRPLGSATQEPGESEPDAASDAGPAAMPPPPPSPHDGASGAGTPPTPATTAAAAAPPPPHHPGSSAPGSMAVVLGGSASPRPPPSAELLTVTPSPPLPLGVAAEPPPFQLHRVTSWRQEMAANGTSAVEIEVEGLDGSRCWLSLHEALRLAVTAAQRGEEDGGWNCAGCTAKGWSNSAVLCCLKCGAPSIIPEAQRRKRAAEARSQQ